MLEAGWAQGWNFPKIWRFLSKRQMTEAEKVQAWIVPKKLRFLSIACMAEARQTQAWNVPKIWRCLSKDMYANSMIGTSLDSSKKVVIFARGRIDISLERDKLGLFQKSGDFCQ